MAVALNAGAGFTSPIHARYQPVLRSSVKVPSAKPTLFGSNSYIHGSRRLVPKKRTVVVIAGKETDDNAITAVDSPPPDSDEAGSQILGAVDDSPLVSKTTRASLTARERLRAARVLGRYTETSAKPKKPEMGSKLLDAMKESDKKARKKPGLPEAPTNLFDDSKRGLPKGFTFQFPGGNDILVIAFSFVLISTVMFATTYLVWKLGAIHFNEY
ncbi:PREDICTED: uncharacterized protein LOC104824327 [Tarenaya hassleriana]|uniref:uncharacterized protein LOC104824327 n=1 Tax=Tarenaya hassleriana TaxID=28532 RepID=UPI00053C0FFF|nr:PREDICTED: uncharacterized protein LOC104824327 [Tarenaya hassleriana]